MRLQSYYDILGIPQNADSNQIKAAFRRLAKLYHPDKNSQGKEHFAKILLAYEVLIDSVKRRQYDLKLKHGSAESLKAKAKSQKQKEWGFSEEELKRRNYFRENYKKEYERYTNSAVAPKNTYNEYKYILFAAPLAVGLLMFVINAYEQSSATEIKTEKTSDLPSKSDELNLYSNPYSNYFGAPVYDTVANRSFVLKNFSTNDAIVCLSDEKGKFLRSFVIKSGLSATVEQLPGTNMNIKIATGKNWRRQKEHKGLNVTGGFNENESYYTVNSKNTNGLSITIDENSLSLMDKIEAKDFFRKY